jgi:Uma2 family endonuclease
LSVTAHTIPKLLTVDEFARIPDPPGGRYELRHGEAVSVSFPEKPHKALQRKLRELLTSMAGDKGVVDTQFPFRPLPEHELWGAGVAFVSKSRYDSYKRWLEGSPELVIDVKSPSNTRQELHDKAMTALAGGTQGFWVVDPAKQTVTVYNRYSGISVYGKGESVPVAEFGQRISLDDLFRGIE